MTLRALLIGLVLGLFVSVFTFFNDGVINGSWFISNHLPISIFGTIVVLLLGLNPLLRLFGQRAPLNMPEVAVIGAIGLASCGWPSFSFYWGFVPNAATPPHWLNTQAAWQEHRVMSYVPGASHELGYGHVQDWPAVAEALVSEGQASTGSVADQVWQQLHRSERQVATSIVAEGRADLREAAVLLPALNRVIREARLDPAGLPEQAALPDRVVDLLEQRSERRLGAYEQEQVNRAILVSYFPQSVLPPPAGEGALVAGGADATAATEAVMHPESASLFRALHEVQWSAWWPVLWRWGGLSMMLSVAALCLAMVVHPQWSKRELLIYPLAQFVTELSRRREGSGLPAVASNRLFWGGLALVAGIHLVNGLGVWLSLSVLKIPLRMDFTPLLELFPNAARVHGARLELFRPYFYLSVIGFAFFLNTSVSFSVGIAYFVYVAFGAMLLARGTSMDFDYLGATPDNLMRSGAFVGMAGMIAFVGRRYYAQLAKRMVGLQAGQEVPTYAVWAGRALILCMVLAVVILCGAGLDWILASLFVLLVMLMFLVMSRIVCETGLFFVQPSWMPVALLTAMFGIEAIGPTSYILLALASIMIVGDPRTALMPYLATGLQMVERSRTPTSMRLGGVLLIMLTVGFFAAGLATMAVVHDRGVFVVGDWSARILPSLPFDEMVNHLAEMRSHMTLAEATATDGLTSLSNIQLSGEAYAWLGAGVVLIALCAFARLRLPWWPIHPVLFLVWGTMPASRLAASFLLGWMIKLAVVKVSGTRGYQTVLPLMVGVIAGEVSAGLGWALAGAIYYMVTGLPPTAYRVYP